MNFRFLIVSVLMLTPLTAQERAQAPAFVPQKPEASKGIPPRTGPGDYQAHGQVGKITIAADFDDHSIPDPTVILSNEDFVFVEVALYGPPGTNLALNYQDFSLKINGKKSLVPAKPYELAFKGLRSPEYQPPSEKMLDTSGTGSKTNVTTGNNGTGNSNTTNITDPKLPPIIHIPIEVSREWDRKVHMASLPEGERPLPVGGLLFFQHDGKTHSAELVYNGPAGKVTIPLQ
jgi:hypothetical protein